jgi:hypothetical protein
MPTPMFLARMYNKQLVRARECGIDAAVTLIEVCSGWRQLPAVGGWEVCADLRSVATYLLYLFAGRERVKGSKWKESHRKFHARTRACFRYFLAFLSTDNWAPEMYARIFCFRLSAAKPIQF